MRLDSLLRRKRILQPRKKCKKNNCERLVHKFWRGSIRKILIDKEIIMKKFINSIKLAALLIILSSTSVFADLIDILKSGTVKIAVPEAFAPFGSVGKSGKHEGYDVDVAKLLAKDLGVKLELVPVVSKQRIPFLETNRVDLVISTMGLDRKSVV